MNQYIMKELMNRGFFESNGILSKFIDASQYIILEDQGTVTVERPFDGDDEMKNRVLDLIQSLAGRYALTQARIKGGKLRVALSRPGSNAREEAVRLDFLIQSIETGIQDLASDFGEAAGEAALRQPAAAPVQRPAETRQEENVRMEAIVRSEMPRLDYPSAPPVKERRSEPVPEGDPINPEEILDEDEFYQYKTVPEDRFEHTSRFHFPEEVTGKPRRRARNTYIPQDPRPFEATDPHPVYATVIDRRFSFIGFLGAGLGVILGAILLGVVRTLGYPPQPAAILVPFLIIGVYRLMAGYQMPIWLGVTFVLGSLLMGSVLVTTTDILSTSSVGFVSAFKSGILAHVDNKNYYVGNVWLKYGVSVLAASIPTMLLLAIGKRKTKVY